MELVEFVASRRGKRLLKFKGYTYYAKHIGIKTLWRCSTHHSYGCKAFVSTLGDEVLQFSEFHDHDLKYMEFVQSRRGNVLMKLKGYTYFRKQIGFRTRWKCSTHHSYGCKAYVTTVGVQFVRSRRGNVLLKLGGYTYFPKRRGLKTRWQCSTHHSLRCKAYVMTVGDDVIDACHVHDHSLIAVEFVTSRRGNKLLKINDYTYFASNVGHRVRWKCSTHHSLGCKAFVTTVGDNIVHAYDMHSHPIRISYKAIPTRSGKYLLMIDGFTFSQMRNTLNYYCSKKDSGCKARVKLTSDGKISLNQMSCLSTHTHPPPKYYRGALMIVLQGYKFLRQCGTGQKTRWWCGTHNNRGCRAVIHTIGSAVVKSDVHNVRTLPKQNSSRRIHVQHPLQKKCSKSPLALLHASTYQLFTVKVKRNDDVFFQIFINLIRFSFESLTIPLITKIFIVVHFMMSTLILIIEKRAVFHELFKFTPKNIIKFLSDNRIWKKENSHIEPAFMKSSYGGRLLVASGYKYSFHKRSGVKIRWRCATHHRRQCKAYAHSSLIGDEILKSLRGADMIAYKGYSFLKHRTSGAKVRWWCRRVQGGCKACIYTFDTIIVRINDDHNHQPEEKSANVFHVEDRRSGDETARLLVHQTFRVLLPCEVALCREPSQTVPRYRHARQNLPSFRISKANGVEKIEVNNYKYSFHKMTPS
ncbi:unnamed protein product, partial [Leptidea sinapis]